MYQPRGLTGGYTDTRIDSNTVRVSFRGNGYTSQETVENYMLYRCAEVTLQNGYDYFIIVSGGTTPIDSSYTTPGRYNSFTTYGYGVATTQGYYDPGQTYTIRRHNSSVLIKMFRGSKPANISIAFSAREIIKYMGSQVKKSEVKNQVSQQNKETKESGLGKFFNNLFSTGT